MTDDLTAAVARLTAESVYPTGNQDHHVRDAIRTVLDALEAAQADARRAREALRTLVNRIDASQLRYTNLTDEAATEILAARAAIDVAMKGEGDGATAAPSEATASVTDPAADPIADLCAELRATHCSNENLHDNAAYELERLARERDDVCNVLTALRAGRQDFMRRIEGLLDRAERAEAERDAAQRESEEQARLLGMSGSREAALLAERDTLRAVVRAADAIWKTVSQTPDRTYAMAAYFTARAKVTLP